MFTVHVYFEFEKKEEWIEFSNKFFSRDEFVQYSPIGKRLKEKNQSFNDVVEYWFSREDEWWLNCYIYILTKSKKVLKNLNEFIKENNYEHNYQLRDNYDKLYMNLDELLN